MALLSQEKEKIVGKFQRADNDTGSPEVQIALLTENIRVVRETPGLVPGFFLFGVICENFCNFISRIFSLRHERSCGHGKW